MSNAVIVKNFGKALIIQFNRPEIRSPLSIFVLDELHEVLDEVSGNPTIEKIIFTGKEDVFASGADLREIAEVKKDTAGEFALRGQNLMNKINASEKKTIAAINGFCFGGALDLALACDKRIASPNAIFSHPGVSLGIITGWGGTQRLPRLVGEAKALEMFLTAKRVDSFEALSIGLIDEISENPVGELLANYSGSSSSISL
ncbi:MAG TPA: enoyl-CoA hydratase/isomerase family protein [Pyrinomonadaceae bacterium]|nr:enoyl-CoA hydratase/isomerase family protein [Pyrinomonadaceae bacterium]